MITAAAAPRPGRAAQPRRRVLADLRASSQRRLAATASILHDLGLRKGDALGLMILNRPEFHVFDAAAMLLGATPFSLYNTSPAEQIAFVMGDAGNRLVVAEPRFADVVREAAGDGVRVVELDELDGGDEDFDLEAHWRAVAPEDLLTLIYTSGTTGPPKGVELDPRQHAGRAARRPRRGAAGGRRALGLVPALGPRRRPLGLALLGAHDLRPHRDAGGRPDAGAAPSWPRSARPPSAASRACGRSSRRRSRPRAPRRWRPSSSRVRLGLRRGALAGRRRGAHAGRGARVLRGARHAHLRGVGHERDLVHRHHQPPGRDEASAPSASRSTAWSCGSPTTASCSSAGRW